MGFPAARLMDNHLCPMVTPGLPPIPHVGGPISGPCVPTVLIGNMPAATLGDMCICVGPPDSIIKGSLSVLIGGKPAARMFDNCAHGGMIVVGCPTVLIGDAPSPSTVMGMQASANGTPFCEICNPPSPAALNSTAPTAGINQGGSPLDDPKVRALIAKSPTLKANLAKLKDWKIRYSNDSDKDGTFTVRETATLNDEDKVIIIDNEKQGNPEAIVTAIAHESGHALYIKPAVSTKGLTKKEYIKKQTEESLKDEGEAVIMSRTVRAEIYQNSNTDIGSSEKGREKYDKIYNEYIVHKDREKARTEISNIYGKIENPSTAPNETYEEYYAKRLEQYKYYERQKSKEQYNEGQKLKEQYDEIMNNGDKQNMKEKLLEYEKGLDIYYKTYGK